MQCTQIQNLLDEYLDGTLNPLQQTAFEQHVADCTACRQHVVFAQALQRRLADLPYPSPSAGFETHVLEGMPAVTRTLRSRKYGFAAGFTTAIAASLGLWLVFMPPMGIDNSKTQNTIDIELVAGQTQQISLVFNSPIAIENATLRLELPRNVELAGYRTQPQLEWQTSLRKGTNRLVLPLIAHGQADKPLLASITSKGKTRTFFVKVSTRAPSAAAISGQRLVLI